jgi:tRNA threonylcarbamoyladenosine biosynthesis protein TsaE
MTAIHWQAPDEEVMTQLGLRLRAGFDRHRSGVVYLIGDLGMGKTTLSRAIIRAFGWPHSVKSPTYTLVESYDFDTFEVHHFDLYRIDDPEELEYLGMDSYFDDRSICLIEWPDKGAPILPPADLSIRLIAQGDGRELVIQSHSTIGNTWCQDW